MAKKRAGSGSIKAVKNEFDDNFLDVVGRDFKFDHAKGLAEWVKNSADGYVTTTSAKDSEQFIFLRFAVTTPKKNSVFECIDFVGMTKKDIEGGFKVWGLATAAKKGTDFATYGGHGNGGKFYMRQMFGRARVITYRAGRVNVFGFDEKKRYGFEKNSEDVPMRLEEALEFAGIGNIDIPPAVRQRWKQTPKQAGFTIVRGYEPRGFGGRATVGNLLERLRVHPQARRILAHKQVFAIPAGQPSGTRVLPPSVDPRPGFEKDRRIDLPKTFDYDGEIHEFRNSEYPDAFLVLKTSEVPLRQNPELAALNTIDILGEVGCLASYRMNELGFLRNAPESEFIYGECRCPMLEDPDLKAVKNDREKLVDTELTRALLEWIKRQVDDLAGQMSEQLKSEKKNRDLRESSLFNEVLDRWKNKFMVTLTAELFGGPGAGGGFGGFGAEGDGGFGTGGKGGGDGDGGEGGGSGREKPGGGGSGDKARRGPAFPRVLLSSHHLDPLDETATKPFECDPRHPPVYQRDIDIAQGIYWINTSRPLAQKIMDQYSSKSARWREYLFQRYVDIIVKQSVHEMAKRAPELRADDVDTMIDTVTSRVHDAAAQDLDSFLFAESLTGMSAGPVPGISDPAASAAGDSAPAEPTGI